MKIRSIFISKEQIKKLIRKKTLILSGTKSYSLWVFQFQIPKKKKPSPRCTCQNKMFYDGVWIIGKEKINKVSLLREREADSSFFFFTVTALLFLFPFSLLFRIFLDWWGQEETYDIISFFSLIDVYFIVNNTIKYRQNLFDISFNCKLQ